jgi:catechol 2,3-dioxygenase
MGHVHLRVADVEESIRFYRDVVGFDLMAQLGDQAAFLSAGGYHHRLGANTWESRGAPPAPEGTARLTEFTIVVPDAHEGERIATAVGGEFRDPSGNAFVLSLAA